MFYILIAKYKIFAISAILALNTKHSAALVP